MDVCVCFFFVWVLKLWREKKKLIKKIRGVLKFNENFFYIFWNNLLKLIRC